jgi:3-phenylpropionate/trans-cinnamate dioxygenase ferredoxin reductase subunit
MTVLIAGAGLAGARCAEALRAFGHEGRIVLVGEERQAPYERPALSKAFLAGEKPAAALALRPASYWDDNGIELVLGKRVDAVDVRRRLAHIDGGELEWSTFVLATGARARRLNPRAHHLRTLDDAHALRDALQPGVRLVVIGAGFIGMEVASTARDIGLDVTVVEPAAAPLLNQLGPEVGQLLAQRARTRGVDLRLRSHVARIERDAVGLGDGTVLPAEVVAAGIGAEPANGLLGSGAVATDACGRTEWPQVFALGDVAAWWRPSLGEHRRFEHWTSAAGQARTVARTILGDPSPYDELPYFWSDQFGLRLQYAGNGGPWRIVELDGHEDAFVARYLRENDAIEAVLAVNRPDAIGTFRRALAA